MKPGLLLQLVLNFSSWIITGLADDSITSDCPELSYNTIYTHGEGKRAHDVFTVQQTTSGDMIESSSFDRSPETNTRSEQMASTIPINRELLNKSSLENLATLPSPIDPCFNPGNCAAVESYEYRFCHCDENCTIYNDCCVDAEKSKLKNQYTPYIICYKGHSLRHFEGFLAVVNCPSTYSNSSVKRMCENKTNIARDGPSVVGPDGTVFKNKYCALCHGIDVVQSFRVSFTFQVSFQLHRIIKDIANFSKTAKVEFLLGYTKYTEVPPPGVTPRMCMLHTHTNEDEMCQAYFNPVYKTKPYYTFYRNFFCVQETERNTLICVGRYYDKLASQGRWDAMPITVMFSFKTSSSDYLEDSCDVWTKRLEEEGRCSDKGRVSNFSFMFKFIKLVSNRLLPPNYIDMIGTFYGLSMEVDNTVRLNYIYYIGVGNTSSILISRFEVTITTTMFANEMEKLNERLENMHWTMYIKDENSRSETIIRKETMHLYDDKASEFDIYENVTGIRPTKIRGGSRMRLKDVIPNNDKICDNIVVKVLIRNSTDINVTDVTCKHQSRLTYDVTFMKTITTYTCFAISVVSLCVLIVLYRKLGLVSSIPGSNLENISISLIMSKLLFMVGIGWSDIRELCYVIGVLLHFLWLSTFYFMSVSVLCIVNNLTKMQSNGQNRKDYLNSKKRCLTLGGLFFPLLFVCPAIVLDVYGDEYLSAGYGHEPCFPNHFPSNLMFFSGPMMLSISINFICLMKVICTIGRLSHEIGHISRSTPFTNAKVYIRVLILSGLFWSIGILTAFVDHEWIEFVFTILCGLQGFFISIASLTTKRVIRNFHQILQTATRTAESSNVARIAT